MATYDSEFVFFFAKNSGFPQ